MIGEDFQFLGYGVSTFRFFVYVAFSIAAAEFLRQSVARGVEVRTGILLVALVCFTAPIGAACLSQLETQGSMREFWSRMHEGTAGSSHFGGVILSLGAILLVLRFTSLDTLSILDSSAAAWSLGYGVGRLACFFAGDGCFGTQTNSIFGVRFEHSVVFMPARVWPTPLIETLYSVLIYSILLRFTRRLKAGELFALTMALMLSCRFLVEFVRVNPKYEGLSSAQWIAAIGVPFFVALRSRLRRSGRFESLAS